MAEETNKHLWEEVNQDIGEVSGLLEAIKSDVRGINEALKLLRTSSNADFPETIVYRVIKQLEANLEGLEARAENHEHQILRILRKIEHNLEPKSNHIEGFAAIQEITMVPLAAGQTATFATTPIPSTSVPNPAALPAWTSSDTTNAPVTPVASDASGLSATVTFPSTVAAGVSFDLTITYTNADGTVATQTNSFTTVAPPSPDITGFAPIVQTA